MSCTTCAMRPRTGGVDRGMASDLGIAVVGSRRVGACAASGGAVPVSKYRNKPVVTPEGEHFDLQAEYSRWMFLLLQQRSGQIFGLKRQVPYQIAPAVKIVGNSRKSPAIRYVADFVYRDANGHGVVEDVKGKITEGYRIKRHLLAVQGIQITEIKA